MGGRYVRADGFSLIELMVALVVVSLGIGGILMAQARGIASVGSASWRLQAAMQAEQLLDLARANPTESYVIDEATTPDAATTAARDLAAWKTRLARALPDGNGQVSSVVSADATTGRNLEQLTVRVGWDDQRGGANDGTGAQRRYVMIQGWRSAP